MRFAAAISLRCCASYTRIQAPHVPNSLEQPDSIVQPSQTSSQSSNGADWSPNPHHPTNTPPPTPNQSITLYPHPPPHAHRISACPPTPTLAGWDRSTSVRLFRVSSTPTLAGWDTNCTHRIGARPQRIGRSPELSDFSLTIGDYYRNHPGN